MNNDEKKYIIAWGLFFFLVITIIGSKHYSDLLYVQNLDLTATQEIQYTLWKSAKVIAYLSNALFSIFNLIMAIRNEAKQN